MSIKYCGIFTDNADFICLGENDDEKFKKFVIKYKSAIAKEPLSKKIELNLGFYIAFLKFNNKVICTVGNAKYKATKIFIESVIDEFTKYENTAKLNPTQTTQKENEFAEVSKIIDAKISLCEGDINETKTDSVGSSRKSRKSNLPEGVNFDTSSLRKSIKLDKEIEEHRHSKNSLTPSIPSPLSLSNGLIKEEETCDVFIRPNLVSGLIKRNKTAATPNSIKEATTNKSIMLPIPRNRSKLIEAINKDLKEIKTITKQNIVEVIKNKEELSELLVQSNNIKENAFDFKDKAKETKQETKSQLCIWSIVIGLLTFIIVWIVCSEVLCGSPISPFCHI